MVQALVDLLMREDVPEWVTQAMPDDYVYDRTVMVMPEGVVLDRKCGFREKNEENYISIPFKAIGYKDLDAKYSDSGKVEISGSRVCMLFALAIQEEMKNKMPNYRFTDVQIERELASTALGMAFDLLFDGNARAEFRYFVPQRELKDLF